MIFPVSQRLICLLFFVVHEKSSFSSPRQAEAASIGENKNRDAQANKWKLLLLRVFVMLNLAE